MAKISADKAPLVRVQLEEDECNANMKFSRPRCSDVLKAWSARDEVVSPGSSPSSAKTPRTRPFAIAAAASTPTGEHSMPALMNILPAPSGDPDEGAVEYGSQTSASGSKAVPTQCRDDVAAFVPPDDHVDHLFAQPHRQTKIEEKMAEEKMREEAGEEKKIAELAKGGMFAFSNTEAIKDKVRAAKFCPHIYNVHDMYHSTGFFQGVARHHYFETITLGVIVVNAMWISIDTDGNTADTILDADPVFVAADVMFFGYFSIEIFVRFCAFKRKCSCLKDGWFVFDSCLMTLYAFDPFVIGFMAFLSGGAGLDLPTAVLRLFRLARLSRLIRMLRSLPELWIMIKGMASAAASVGYTLGLLLLVTYVFAIALRNLVPPAVSTDDDSEDIEIMFFSSVPEAMHNLIIFGTFLDALSDFILAVKAQSVPCFILCWFYIALASLTIMNMLIGVLCEVISAVAEEEKESIMVDKVNDTFGTIVADLDENNDGTLSWEEFQHILDYPEALRALESVNIDAESMVDLAESFFFDDGVPIAVSFEDFMGMVLDLRGGQQATVKDVMSLGKTIAQKFIRMKQQVADGQANVAGITKSIDVNMRSRVDAFEQRITANVGEMKTRIDGFEGTIKSMDSKMDQLLLLMGSASGDMSHQPDVHSVSN